jgi:hypothetical protein
VLQSKTLIIGLGAAMLAATPIPMSPQPADDAPSSAHATVVIDRTSESVPVDAAARKELEARALADPDGPSSVLALKEVPLPAGVKLQPGESVQVNYSNGVAVHQMNALGCTATSTVDTPYVSGGYAWSYHTYGLGTNCSGSTDVNGILESHSWPLWHWRDWETRSVTPGSKLYWATNKKCVNGGLTSWHSLNTIGSSTISSSPDKELACNPG